MRIMDLVKRAGVSHRLHLDHCRWNRASAGHGLRQDANGSATRRPSKSRAERRLKIEGLLAARIVWKKFVHVVDGILIKVQRDWHGNRCKRLKIPKGWISVAATFLQRQQYRKQPRTKSQGCGGGINNNIATWSPESDKLLPPPTIYWRSSSVLLFEHRRRY